MVNKAKGGEITEMIQNITHRWIDDAHMIVVLILVVDTYFDAIGIRLMEFLDVWTPMRWTRLFGEHAMILVVCVRILGWGWKVR